MGDDERLPPLSRRVPDENRGHKPAARVSPLQLPDEVVARMLAAVRAGAAEDAAVQDPAAAPKGAASQPSGPEAAQPPVAAAQAAAAETQDRSNRHKLESPRLARKRTAHAARQAEEKRRAEEKRQAEQDRQARAEENQRAARERVAAEAARQEPATVARPRTAVDRPGSSRDDETTATPEAARAAGPRGFGRLRNRRLDLDLDRRADDDTDQFPAIAPEAVGISGRGTAGASAPRDHETRPAAAAGAPVLPVRTPNAPLQPAQPAAASAPVLPTRTSKAPAQPAAAANAPVLPTRTPKAPPQPAQPAVAATAPVLPTRTPKAPAQPAAAANAPVLPTRTPKVPPPAQPAATASAPVLPARTPQAQPPAEPAQPAAAASAPVLPARTPREPAQPAAVSKVPERPAAAAKAPAQPVRTPPERSARPARGKAAPAVEVRQPQVGRRYRLVGAVAAVAAVAAAGVVALVISRPSPPESSAISRTEVLQRAAGTRDLTAAWIVSQISRATIVSCDAVMCSTLQSHGFPAAKLLTLKPGVSPLHSVLVVATAAIRKQLGSQLSATYAPSVIARFGSGDEQIDIRAVAPHGVAAYQSALSSDLQLRKLSGAQLLSSSRIGVGPALAGTQLAEGKVDSRVLFTLTNLAFTRPIEIVAFGDGGPGANPSVSPLRSVEVRQVPNSPHLSNALFMTEMLARLRTQPSLWVATSAQQVHVAGQGTVLRIEFSAPSTLGLLNSSSPIG